MRLSTDVCPHSCTLNAIDHSSTACVTGLLIHTSLSCVYSVRPADNNVSTPTFFPLDSLQKKLKDLEEENKSLRSEVEKKTTVKCRNRAKSDDFHLDFEVNLSLNPKDSSESKPVLKINSSIKMS